MKTNPLGDAKSINGQNMQIASVGVPFHFKQWGEHGPLLDARGHYVGFAKVGKKKAGRLLDGREWNKLPSIT